MVHLRDLVAIIVVATGVAITSIGWIVIVIIVTSVIIAMAIGRVLIIIIVISIPGVGVITVPGGNVQNLTSVNTVWIAQVIDFSNLIRIHPITSPNAKQRFAVLDSMVNAASTGWWGCVTFSYISHLQQNHSYDNQQTYFNKG
jgi:hypothetical protein